jgi:hypothetical protein
VYQAVLLLDFGLLPSFFEITQPFPTARAGRQESEAILAVTEVFVSLDQPGVELPSRLVDVPSVRLFFVCHESPPSR